MSIRLLDSTPAALKETPIGATANADDAATDSEEIVACSSAVTVTSPRVVLTPLSAFRIEASTALPITFRARATPTETETPAVPAKDAAREVAPVSALIVEVSAAVRDRRAALMPSGPSPSMNARTLIVTIFSVLAPAP
ncbi:MAG TPA: hypothetical protein VMX97_02660, partial [Hyphomicrobiaceae bacterium]|nr:hypothetical protein [Hyphomicrobiaceae bacterium]